MTHVATLVCNPECPALSADVLRRACDALSEPGPPQWLDPCVAADIAFEPGSPGECKGQS